MLEINLQAGLKETSSEILILPFFEGESLNFGPEIGKDFARKANLTTRNLDLPAERKIKLTDIKIENHTYRVLLLTLGPRKNISSFQVKETFGKVSRHLLTSSLGFRILEGLGIEKAGIAVPTLFEKDGLLEYALEGYILSSYRFRGHREDKSFNPSLALFLGDKKVLTAVTKLVQRVRNYTEGVFKVRDSVNEPPNILNPKELVRRCLDLKKSGKVKVKVLDSDQVREKGLEALYSVGKGSRDGARLVCLEYLPEKSRRKVAIVGKGVTFDTGGYSIKNYKQMLNMKGDMLGAAFVMETIRFAASQGANLGLIGIIPVAENLVNENAFKPDDVIKTLGGKTVEIVSTDAEGRLMLADALSYSLRYKPDELLDVGTISGVCNVSLGDFLAPYVTNSEKLAKLFDRASEVSGEAFLRIPLKMEYLRYLKSDIADLKNVSIGSGGNLITPAVFLSMFVGNLPWVHVDLAGVDFQERESSPIYPRGSTGFGLKTIFKYLDLI